MIKLRHILHPVRSAKTLYGRVRWRMNEREYEKIPRGQRNKCWCGGELGPFKWHTSYGVCADCGCYVNRYPPLPEALERVYSLNLHWRARQKIKGHLPIEARSGLYRSEGRLDYWLSLVEKYGPRRGRAIEVGCSPGVLLAELQQRGFECVGVEPDYKVAQWIQDHFGVEVRKGLFPGVELPPCDLFLALDVAEHVPDPAAFWTELARLLRPGGVAILQTPVERYDYDHPFRSRPDLLDDVEHLFLYTDRSVYRLADHARLEMVCLEDAIGTLGQICVLSKPERSSTLRS